MSGRFAAQLTPLSMAAWLAGLFLASTLFPHSVALRLTLLLAGLVLVTIGLAHARTSGRDPGVQALPPLLVPILLWSAWAGLSVLWSQEPERSQKEFRNEVVYAFLGYWLCFVAVQAQGARRAFGIALGAAGVLACLVGIYVFLSLGAPAWIARLASGPGDQSSAMLTLMPCALLAIWLARNDPVPRTLQFAMWTLPLLIFAAAYVTLNRTVWVGFAVEFGIMAALLLSRAEFEQVRRKGRARLLAGLLVAVVGSGVVLAMIKVQEKRVELEPSAAVTKDPRPEIWASAMGTIEQHPVTGLGFGRGIARRAMVEELGNILFGHAHNLLLETAVGSGLPGAALLLFLICMTAYNGWRLARGDDAQAAVYGIALVGIVAGMFVRNMTDVQLARQNALLYWGVVGMMLGLGSVRRASKLNSTLLGDLRHPTR